MNINKILLFLILLISAPTLLYAQGEDHNARIEQRIKEVQEFKMKYLAQEMELSEVQKKKFFELYEEMSRDKRECYKEAMQLKHRLKHDKDATEEDYKLASDAMNKANDEWAVKEKQYDEKFADFLTPKQIYKMKEAENNYRAKYEGMKHNRSKERKR